MIYISIVVLAISITGVMVCLSLYLLNKEDGRKKRYLTNLVRSIILMAVAIFAHFYNVFINHI